MTAIAMAVASAGGGENIKYLFMLRETSIFCLLGGIGYKRRI
jgi:hypothetical protein